MILIDHLAKPKDLSQCVLGVDYDEDAGPKEGYGCIYLQWATDEADLANPFGNFHLEIATSDPYFDAVVAWVLIQKLGFQKTRTSSSINHWEMDGGRDLAHYLVEKNEAKIAQAKDWLEMHVNPKAWNGLS
jgi:hypothetical protein